jgi:hypothetical protein
MKTAGRLQDADGNVWARFEDAHEFYGAILAQCHIVDMPEDARAAFKKHEEMASKQLLRHIDQIEQRIAALNLQVVWESENEPICVCDVQVGESTLSFRLKKDTLPSAPI